MWQALFTAILDWLTGLVMSQSRTAGEDVKPKPGLIATLLRCQRAQLNQRAAGTVAAAKAGGVVGALLIGIIEAGKHLFGK